MDIINNFFSSITWEAILNTTIRLVLLLIIAFLIMKVVLKTLQKVEARLLKRSKEAGETPSESQKRVETLIRLLRQAVMLALWLTAGLVAFKEMGFDIGPIIASAGIVGLAIGFGAQNLVRDIISGFFIILENQMRVGDVAIINGTGGLVEKINFRTTVIRDLSGTVHVFPNGSISTLSNLTNEWSAFIFDIGVAYKEETDRVIELMHKVCHDMLDDPYFGKLIIEDPEIFGVDKFADSAVMIKGRIKTKPIRQWEVGREFLRRIKIMFDEHQIEIPYPHRSIYFGENSNAFDLKVLDQKQGQC